MRETLIVRRVLPILYRDEHLVAVDKPSGLLVHRTHIDARERRFALQMVREQMGQRVYAVHRLDKGTSGVLLFALSREVGTALSQLFAATRVHKTYVAIVRGVIAAEGEIDHPLAILSGDGVVDRAAEQPAVTRFRRLATVELAQRVDRYPSTRYSLAEVIPISGRRHQIRRHMKHIAHPIIGDATYGKGRHNRLFRDLFASDRLLLACIRVCLPHPVTGEPLSITAPLASDFRSVVAKLGWAEHSRL